MIRKVVWPLRSSPASLDMPQRRRPLPPALRRPLPRVTIIISTTIITTTNKRPSRLRYAKGVAFDGC
jgi:hypothetical protein